MTNHDQHPNRDPAAGDPAAPTDAQRRAALRTLGALAALTPPTVMTLLLSPRAEALSLGIPPGGP